MSDLRAYLIASIPAALRDPTRLTEQARRVRSLLVNEDLTDRARVQTILDLLLCEDRLEHDTLVWLKTILRGHYGIEYAAADLAEVEQVRFWGALSDRFPQDPKLRLVRADALLVAGELDLALDLFNESFEQDPASIYEVGGEVAERMQERGGQLWLRYRLAMLRNAVRDEDAELVEELTSELREEFAGDPDVQAAVERAVGRD